VKKFDMLFSKIMEDNIAGSGGALGTFQTSDWTNIASGTPGTDTYAPGDYRRPTALGAKVVRGKKKKKKNQILIQRRPFISM